MFFMPELVKTMYPIRFMEKCVCVSDTVYSKGYVLGVAVRLSVVF